LIALTVPATAQFVPLIAASVREACCHALVGEADRVAASLELAAVEACTNVIRHGYAGGRRGPITLRVRVAGAEIELLLEDRGVPFDPTTVELPPAGELREGGYGLRLIRETVDRVTYERRGGYNRLRLVKSAGAAGPDSAGING